MRIGFRNQLTARQIEINSVLCVGLDPEVEKMPMRFRMLSSDDATAVLMWMMWVVDQTAPHACMFKPQHAHWEEIPGGEQALIMLIAYIHHRYPNILVFIDCKRGDIDRTQNRYRLTHLVREAGDGVNYNGYMGSSTLKSLIDTKYSPGKALVGLGRTSNKEAWEVQDEILKSEMRVWERQVRLQLKWSREFGVLEDAGIVMGAAYFDEETADVEYEHLETARKIVGTDMWFLIPGIGAQKGVIKETVQAAFAGAGTVAISCSSAITNAENPAEAAWKLCNEMRAAGANCN